MRIVAEKHIKHWLKVQWKWGRAWWGVNKLPISFQSEKRRSLYNILANLVMESNSTLPMAAVTMVEKAIPKLPADAFWWDTWLLVNQNLAAWSSCLEPEKETLDRFKILKNRTNITSKRELNNTNYRLPQFSIESITSFRNTNPEYSTKFNHDNFNEDNTIQTSPHPPTPNEENRINQRLSSLHHIRRKTIEYWFSRLS